MTNAGLFVISGPSGVGKGTVIAEVLRQRPDLWLSVSTTTRVPRPGDLDGREYFFVDKDWFEQAAATGEFLEWATYSGNSYGTSSTPVQAQLDAGRSVVLEIDLAGARQVRVSRPDALLVMITPPNRAELESRLRGRGTEGAAELAARLAAADSELASSNEFDYVIVNDEISATANKLIQLIDRHQGSAGPSGAEDRLIAD